MKTVDPDRRVNYSSLEADEVIADLHSHPMGLTHAESTRRLGGHGPNALPYTAMRVTLLPLVRQPLAWLVGLLLVGSAVSLAADSPNTAVTFLVLAIINAGLTLWQAWQAKPYLDDLQQLIPLRAKVIRNGSTEEI